MTMISFVTSSSSSSSSARSSSSSSTPIVFVFFGTLMLCFALLFVVQNIGPKAVSSFSLTSSSFAASRVKVASSSSALFQSSTTTESTTPSSSTTDSTALMEAQAGGHSSNRRRRKQRIQNYLENKSDDDETSHTKIDATVHSNEGKSSSSSLSSSFQEPNEPLVPFESVKSVKLIDDDNDESGVRVEVSLIDDTTTIIINPIDIDQTVDFNLWMLFRKEIVDVSASQLSVVLDNNYFTSRAQLLSDKITVVRRRKKKEEQKLFLQKQQQQQQNDVVVDNTDSQNSNNQTASSSSSRMGNSKACAWGVKMEPIAFAQYKDIVENNNGIIINDDNVKSDEEDDDNNNDDENNSEKKKRNLVEETGMYLMRYTDPDTKKTFTFGASPDGLVTEYNNSNEESVGVLEIKSLWGRRNKSTLPTFDQCPNRFYDQIQGQLAVCDKEWCDLMLFIPPGSNTGTGTTVQRSNKRKGKSKAKRRKQQVAKDANAAKVRKSKGNNYAIVRVKRNRIYWNETVLPALMKFCNEVESLSELSESELELKLLEEAKESDESESESVVA